MDDFEGYGKIIALIGLIASIITICIFVTGVASLPAWFNGGQLNSDVESIQPTAISINTPTVQKTIDTPTPIQQGLPDAPISQEYDCQNKDDSIIYENLTEFLIQAGVGSALLVEPQFEVSGGEEAEVSQSDIETEIYLIKQDYYDAFSGSIQITELPTSHQIDWKDRNSVNMALQDYDVDVVVFTDVKADIGSVATEFYWITRVCSSETGNVVWIGHCYFTRFFQ